MKSLLLPLVLSVSSLLSACGNGQVASSATTEAEDYTAKELLQGIWVDDESESIQFKVEKDTIYYPDATYSPLYFKVIRDSLIIYSAKDTTAYKIDHQNEYEFWFHSLSNEIVKLHKSENEMDSLVFSSTTAMETSRNNEVIQKDSVIISNGRRFRGYVYINPSTMKVYKTSYTETGMNVENVYYDNVIHICVYEGKNCLYAKDFTKQDFKDLVPEEFLGQAILTDMEFTAANTERFEYQASLCIPEDAGCYSIDVLISHDGKLSMRNSVFP